MPSRALAANVASLRAARRLSQAALARAAGMPRSTLTWIESGEGNPSLRVLVRLAGALRVGIEELLVPPRPECVLVRADAVPRRDRGGCRVHRLLPDPVPGMEIDRMELEPGARLTGVPHLVGTKEYFTVVRGEVTVHVAGEAYRVGAGDVLAFPGHSAHSYHATGRGGAVGVSVVTLAGGA